MNPLQIILASLAICIISYIFKFKGDFKGRDISNFIITLIVLTILINILQTTVVKSVLYNLIRTFK